MSYEGTNHKLCKNGHYASFDALEEMYEECEEDYESCDCGKLYAYVFYQDQTNGDDPEHPCTLWPDMAPWVVEEAKFETCNLGHRHELSPARYKVPDNGLWRPVNK